MAQVIILPEFSDYKKAPLPATLWIGNECFPLIIKDSLKQPNTTVKRIGKLNKIRFTITVSTFHDEYADHYPSAPGDTQTPAKPVAPKKINGKALLVYRCNNQNNYYEIKNIMQHLPHQDYP